MASARTIAAMLTTPPQAPPPPHPIISSTPSIRWPLHSAESVPPMHYLRPEELTDLRLRAKPSSSSVALPSSQHDRICEDHAWMDNIPQTISSLFGDEGECPQSKYDYTVLALSIVLLGHSYADEAHSLVTPYSWPEEIHTSYGPVRYATSDPGVVSVATYVHSLVHRREGHHVGEFGMTGWANADYWGNAWRRPVSRSEDLREFWRGPALDFPAGVRRAAEGNPAGLDWCAWNLPAESGGGPAGDAVVWDPRALHRLCARATSDAGDEVDEDLIGFAEGAVEAELRVLLSHCLALAGYSPIPCD